MSRKSDVWWGKLNLGGSESKCHFNSGKQYVLNEKRRGWAKEVRTFRGVAITSNISTRVTASGAVHSKFGKAR